MDSLRTMLIQLAAVFIKEVRQTVQDRRIVFLLTLAPMIQLTVFGYAIDFDVDRVQTVIIDQDRSPEGRRALETMLADGTLTLVDQLASVAEGERALEEGWAAVALVVPQGYARDLARGEPTSIQVIVDGTDPTRSAVAIGAAGGAMATRALELQARSGRPPGVVQVRPRLLFNPTLSSPIYMVPGIAGMLLLIITTVVTAMGLAREREVGTLEQVRVTPLPPAVLMVGKVAPFVVVGLLDVTMAMGLGAWLFDVPLRGSMALFYGVTALYLLSTIGAGLAVSTLSTSQQQAFTGAFVFVLPAMLLSGTMTPIHAMPEWLVPITWVNPLRFYLEAVRGVLVKGATAADLWLQITLLLVYGVGILGFASTRFRKRLD
jgi:ABC-2 type transport system permease protein